MNWVPLLWIIPLGLSLLALTVLVGYICGVLGGVRNSIHSIDNTLKSVKDLVDKEVGTLLQDIDQTVKEVNDALPQLLENINGITASIQQISESEIQPTTHSIQEMTETINQNVAKIDELINLLTDFSQQTVKRAGYYRDQLSVPVTDIISLWSGIKAGWEVFSQSRKQDTSEPKDVSDVST